MMYRDLLLQLLQLNEEQLSQDVTILKDTEYYSVSEMSTSDNDDVLDSGHVYLTVE